MTSIPRDLPPSGTHDHDHDDVMSHLNFIEAVAAAHNGMPTRCRWCGDQVVNRTISMGGSGWAVETIHADECLTNERPELTHPAAWGAPKDAR